MDFSFNVASKIKVDTLETLREYLIHNIKDRNLLILVSNTMIERFQLKDLIETLSRNNTTSHIYHIPPNPTELDCKTAIESLDGAIDTVFALGGGSAIDLAKAVIALQYLDKNMLKSQMILDAIVKKEYLKHKKEVEFIAVPTTAGTSSEVTSWATIWKSDKTEKMSIDAPWLAPSQAFILPELTLTMSKRLTLATGLDALTHATESYWSRKSNSISRELSKNAIRQITRYLPLVLEAPDNLAYREKMCIGSAFAGLAFANTRTTACHSISYPLTMMYGIDHGFAAAMTLVEVMRANQDYIIELDALLDAFGAKTVDEVKTWMDQTSKDIQPLNLEAFHISQEDIPRIVSNSFTAGRMDNNPVNLTEDDIAKILNRCY